MELWFIVFQEKLYVISGAGTQARWVRNLLKNPKVVLRIEESVTEGHARVLDLAEQPLWDTVSRMACDKYREPESWGTPVEISIPPAGEKSAS